MSAMLSSRPRASRSCWSGSPRPPASTRPSRCREGPDGLLAEYVGDDLGLLIGHHGQTIDAIQHLAYRFAMQGDGERQPVTVDAAGYRERRAVALRATADQAAETAVNHGARSRWRR